MVSHFQFFSCSIFIFFDCLSNQTLWHTKTPFKSIHQKLESKMIYSTRNMVNSTGIRVLSILTWLLLSSTFTRVVCFYSYSSFQKVSNIQILTSRTPTRWVSGWIVSHSKYKFCFSLHRDWFTSRLSAFFPSIVNLWAPHFQVSKFRMAIWTKPLDFWVLGTKVGADFTAKVTENLRTIKLWFIKVYRWILIGEIACRVRENIW